MARMVRKQVYIEARQEELLKRRAKELGVSEAALIRQGIDQLTLSGASARPDLQAWEEEKAFIEERMRMDVPQTGRMWTRDELYDERLDRFQRITVNPSQMGGVPCLRGLRIPVATVVAMVADGMTEEEILQGYPDLQSEDIREALRFAAAAVRERELPLVARA